jgi:hypothetical protein
VVKVSRYRSRGPGFDSRHNHISWEVVGLEQGPLSLLSTIEELLRRTNSCSCLGNLVYGRGDLLSWPRSTLYPQKLALSSLTSGGRSVGIVRSSTKGHAVKDVCKFMTGERCWRCRAWITSPLCDALVSQWCSVTEGFWIQILSAWSLSMIFILETSNNNFHY